MIKHIYILIFCVFLYGLQLLNPTPTFAEEKPLLTSTEFALKKLEKNQISKVMIQLLEKSFKSEKREKIIQTNVLGFLERADYSGHFSPSAIDRCHKFIKKNKKQLLRIEKMTGVSHKLITALLWVETKHGKVMGNYSVPNVFFTLIQADHPDLIRSTVIALSEKAPNQLDEYKQKTIDRSYAKANWALGEIKSLDEILSKKAIQLKKLEGSSAGAFGISQFIPSSYLQWARPKSKTKHPDLFNVNDAIHSVGYYLKVNGWKAKDSAAQREALFHYNRSNDYVDIILKIASAL